MIKKIILKYPGLGQFFKFIVVGFMNTAIDFLVLNFLMWQTGIYQGKWIISLNAISFSIAISNSYFWNKYWTFRAKGPAVAPLEMSQFLIVSLIGTVINSGVIFGLTTYIPPAFGLGRELWPVSNALRSAAGWANFAKVMATGLSLIWNFLGYKFVVFRR